MLEIIVIIVWLVAGIVTLACNRKVSRFHYFLCWITLMLNLIIRVMVEGV